MTEIPTALAQPAQRALRGAGINHLEDLQKFTEAEVKKLHGMGPNALGKLKAAMEANDFEFAKGA